MKSRKNNADYDAGFSAGEQEAEKRYRKQVKELQKQMESNYKTLESTHRKEVAILKKQVSMKLSRLEKREIALDRAMSDWQARIEEADRYILTAKNTMHAKMIEKKEIFQRLARHIAEESHELDNLLAEVHDTRSRTAKKNRSNPFYLKKTS